jgi:hypothetical protein
MCGISALLRGNVLYMKMKIGVLLTTFLVSPLVACTSRLLRNLEKCDLKGKHI